MRRFVLPLLSTLVLLTATLPALAQDRRADEHSYAQPDKVRITDLALDLGIDFGLRELSGTAILTLAWTDEAHRELVLDTRDLSIVEVEGAGKDGQWQPLQ